MKKIISFFRTDRLVGLITEIFVAFYCFSIITFGSMPIWHYSAQIILSALGLFLVSTVCFRKDVVSSIRYLLGKSFLLPFAFFVVFSSLLNFRNSDFTGLLSFVMNIGAFFVILLATRFFSNWDRLFRLLFAAYFAFLIIFLVYYRDYLLRLDFSNRLGDAFGNENDVGMALSFGFSLSLILAFYQRKYWVLISSPLFCLGALLTGSRKALIIIAISAFFLLVYRFRKQKKALVIVFASLIVAAGITFLLPASRLVLERFADAIIVLLSGGETMADGSAYDRLIFLKSSFYYGCHSPLIGNGYLSFSKISGFGYYSHNTFGEIFCDFGFFALLAYAFFTLLPLKAKINDEGIRSFSILFSVLYFVLGFLCVLFYSKTFYITFALIFGASGLQWSAFHQKRMSVYYRLKL